MLKKTKGFTLIELLVVISIIALLLSILMPALSKVKEKARAIVCRSNLKQISQAMIMYSVEHDDKTMAVEWYANVDPGEYWFFQLRPYLGLKNGDQYGTEQELAVGYCPSTKPPITSWLVGTAKHYWQWQGAEGSYGINLWATEYIISPDGLVYNPPSSIGIPWGNRLASIPGRVPFVGDCNWVGNLAQDTDEGPYNGGSNDYTVEEGPQSLAPGWSNVGRYCLDRHNMAINMGFVDGHVEGVPLEELWKLKWHRGFKFTEMKINRR